MEQPAAGRSSPSAAPSCGQLLRRYRRRAGLTQEELGERSGYSANYIGKLERDQRELPLAALDRLATILGLGDEEQAALLAAREGRRGGAPRARPLAGRDRETAELRRHLAGLGPTVLLFAGDPGIGKTRLLEEAASRAAQDSWRVVQGGCQRRGLDPYAPITGALLATLQRLPDAERAQALEQAGGLELLLPELAAAAEPPTQDDRADPWIGHGVGREQQRRVLFSAVESCVRAVAGEAGVLLILDDLHWAGPDALDLLAALLDANGSPPIRLVGAYRDSESMAGGRLGELVADLARASRVRVLRLDPLSDAESEQLLTQLAADAEELRTALPAIVRRAGGVPFFLVSFLEDLRAGDPATAGPTLPWTVRQVIGQRVLALPESAQEPLAVAALAGRVVSRSLLVGVSKRSEENVLAALEAAAAARLLAEDQTGDYSFTHDLIRETIEDSLSGGRRRLLHLRIAETLERDAQASAETLAFHFVRSDDRERAIAYLELAGDQAQQRVAYAAAAELFQQAIDRHSTDSARETPALSEKLGVALYRGGHYDNAITALEDALNGYRAAGDEDSVHRLTGRLADAHFRHGTNDDALEHEVNLLEGGPLVPASAGSDHTVARWQGLVRLLYARSSFKRLLSVGRSLSRLGRATGNPKLQRIGKRVEGGALIYLGRVREGTGLLETTMPRDPGAEKDERAAEVAALLSSAQLSMGRLEPARALSTRMLSAAESTGDTVVAAMHAILLATIHYVEGDWTHGHELLRRSQERLHTAGLSPLTLRMTPAHAETLIWAGNWQQARSYLESVFHSARSMQVTDAERAAIVYLARLDLLEGHPEAALTRLQPLPTKDLGWGHAIQFLTTLAAAHLELGDPVRAQPHAEHAVAEARRLDGWVFGIRALEVLGTVESKRGHHDRAETAYQEGLGRARTIPFPYAEAQVLHAYAVHDRERGDKARAQTKLAEALAILERLEARAETPMLRDTIAGNDAMEGATKL